MKILSYDMYNRTFLMKTTTCRGLTTSYNGKCIVKTKLYIAYTVTDKVVAFVL